MYKLLDYGQEIDHMQNIAVDGNITSNSVPMRGGGILYQLPESGIRKGAPGSKYIAYVFISLGNIIT